MEQRDESHNWQPNDFDIGCVRCGAAMFNVINELTEAAKKPCPGRTVDLQRAIGQETRSSK